MFPVSVIAQNLALVHQRMAETLSRSGRAIDSAHLIAVTKKQPQEALTTTITESAKQGWRCIIGENYLQEFQQKSSLLTAPVECHLIGRLQRNKVSKAVGLFTVIESVDSLELLEAINRAAAEKGIHQEIYLQVNVSADPKKGGIALADVPRLLETARSLTNLNTTGLMTITELYPMAEDARADFAQMRELRDSLDRSLELSMGMSSDYQVALEEGATRVRVGSLIFGERG